jgi:pimeloyl-ACP methyl ester carboxylesterase
LGLNSTSLRVRRHARLAVWLVGVLALVHVLASDAVASAIALAPNASRFDGKSAAFPMPAVLAHRGAYPLRIDAGVPSATLVSWVVPPRELPVRATVLLLHGVRMDKRSLVPVALALSDAGYRAVLVDLRGHGESTGRFLTYGVAEARDLSAILDALGERSRGGVGVYGFSYGAAVAIELSARDARIGAVVSIAPFSSLREVTADYERNYLPGPLRFVPDAWFQRAVDAAGARARFDPDRAAPARAVTRSTAPVLLVHGDADTQVPLRHSTAIAQAAGKRAELMEIPGATHADMPADRTGTIRRAAVEWFERWLS